MPLPEKTDRNEKIYLLVEAGEKISFVAEKFKISRERVYQIYLREKVKQLSPTQQ